MKFIIMIVQIVVVALGAIIWGLDYKYAPIIGAVLIAISVAYSIFSLFTVNGTQVAAEEELGRPVGHRGPGLHYAPLGLYNLIPYPGTEQQNELPAEPELVYDGEGATPKGFFPANRVKFGQPRVKGYPGYNKKKDGLVLEDPYNIAMVVAVPLVVSWIITDAKRFREVYGDIANCLKILNDKAVEVFAVRFATMTPARALLELAEVSREVQHKLETETYGTGIEIKDAYVKQFNFSHTLNTAVVNVQVAERNARATEKAAEGAANAAVTEAEGRRKVLLKTGLARETATGGIELLPDAATKAHADAVAGLKELKGTLVLGNGVTTTLDVNKK